MSVFPGYTIPYPPALCFVGGVDERGGLPAGAADDLLGAARGVGDQHRDLLDRVAGGAQHQRVALARTERGEHLVCGDHRDIGRRGETRLRERFACLPLPFPPIRAAAVARGADDVFLRVEDLVLLGEEAEERVMGDVLGVLEGDPEPSHGIPQQQREQRHVPFFGRHMRRSRMERVQSSPLYSC
jgi:hypothetical protein